VTDTELRTVLDVLGYSDADGLMTSSTEAALSARGYVWSDLRNKVGLDAAFFNDGVPVVGFAEMESPQGLRQLRKRLWNYGRVPILITTLDGQVDVYDGLSRPDDASAAQSAKISLVTKSGFSHRYSRESVGSGLFAAQFTGGTRTTTVEHGLLRNLRFLRRTLTISEPQRSGVVDALVGASIVTSYLADRGVLNEMHLRELCSYPTFDDVLKSGVESTAGLFRGLARHFNGDVFGEIAGLCSILLPRDIEMVRHFLRGDDLETRQQSLWPYDFSVLPSDLVSTIYEQLVDGTQARDSAFYTPRLLVDVVLDEVLPWDDSRPIRLIDPACGSGAFLAEAFRRIVYRTQMRRGRRLGFSELRRILTTQIFGIDRNETAARIAAFGLYLALLESLEPKTIWRSAVLPNVLGTNILVSDSFEQSHRLISKPFDVVVGNPPWKSELSEEAARFTKEVSVPIADKQVAHAYLWLAREVLKPGGMLGLLMPAKGLLHNRSKPSTDFRKMLFSTLEVQAIYDLSALRRQLFVNAIAPSAVLIARKPKGHSWRGQPVMHAAPHPRQYARIVDSIILAPEEVSEVPYSLALSRPDIWTTLVWGSTEDQELLDFLATKFSTLETFARERGWNWGQGYKRKGADQNDAAFLAGLPEVIVDSVAPFHFEEGALFDSPTLTRPRKPATYKAPRILIKRTLHAGRIAAAVTLQNVVFSSGLIGLGGVPGDEDLLLAAAAVLNSSVSNYWHFLTSSSWGVERPAVEENEFRVMPMALPTTQNQMKALKQLVAKRSFRPDQLDAIVFDMFDLSAQMRLRISDFMRNRLPQLSSTGIAKADMRELLKSYAEVIQHYVGAALGEVSVTADGRIDHGYGVVTVQFSLKAHNSRVSNPFDPVGVLARAAERRTRNSAIVALPAGFFVDSDTVYIVKTIDPDRWTGSVALRDSKRVFAVLVGGD
jgi:N-6 DNA Methylase